MRKSQDRGQGWILVRSSLFEVVCYLIVQVFRIGFTVSNSSSLQTWTAGDSRHTVCLDWSKSGDLNQSSLKVDVLNLTSSLLHLLNKSHRHRIKSTLIDQDKGTV